MSKSHFFHYTNSCSIKKIFSHSSEDSGLQSERRFIPLGMASGLPRKAHDGATWGMLSPRPIEYASIHWGKGESFFHDCLRQTISRLSPTFMIKADVTPNDSVYVADWGVHLRPEFLGTTMKNKKIIHEVKTAYWNSLIPLKDYKEGTHTLPEVICFSDIQKEQLSVELTIPGSEMDRYIQTGHFDTSKIEEDKENLKILDARRSEHMAKIFQF